MKIFFLFLFILCLSCNKATIDSFEIIEKISNYDSIWSDRNEPFNTITDMEIFDNVLIMKHANDKYYFSFIDINDRRLIRRWGKRGRGPGEYVKLGSGFTILGPNLIFLDAMHKEINYISIPDITKSDTFSIYKEVYPYTKDFRPRHLNIVNDKKIAVGSFKEEYFGILDSNNNIINNSYDYPFAYEGIEGINRGSVFQTKIRSNYALNKFVISTLASDVFEIYHVTEENIKRIYVSPFNYKPIISMRGGRYGLKINESIAGLLKMAVTDNMICFSYSSESYEKALKAGLASKELLCFDWNGKKIKKYILPFPVRTFCIEIGRAHV